MLRIILRRIFLSIPLIIIVSAITFVLESLVPGDPARTLLGVAASPEQYEALRQTLHLDQPIIVQYWLYLANALHGDLGSSIFTDEPVAQLMAERLPVTLAVVVGGTAVASAVGVLFGVFSATRGRIARRVVDVVSVLGNAIPNFWLALVLAAVFAVGLGLFPATGFVPFEDSPAGWAQSLVLPVVALAIGGIALISKVTRDTMLSTLSLDFIRTLRASGISERSIIWKHALRHSGVTIVTVIGLTMLSFIPGSVFVENVFVLPGLGNAVVDATNQHDIPVVQGVALTFTVLVIIVNLLVDIAYGLLNPKVRSE